MRSHVLEHASLGSATIAAVIGLDWATEGMVGQIAVGLLVWTLFSALLVVPAGAWAAFISFRRGRRSSAKR